MLVDHETFKSLLLWATATVKVSTTVFTLAELFALKGSTKPEATVATLVIVTGKVGRTVMVAATLPPLTTLPRLVKATMLPLTMKPAGAAETNCTLDGRVLVNLTVGAVAGPRLKIVLV